MVGNIGGNKFFVLKLFPFNNYIIAGPYTCAEIGCFAIYRYFFSFDEVEGFAAGCVAGLGNIFVYFHSTKVNKRKLPKEDIYKCFVFNFVEE